MEGVVAGKVLNTKKLFIFCCDDLFVVSGVKADADEALTWFKLAAAGGHLGAKKDLKRFYGVSC